MPTTTLALAAREPIADATWAFRFEPGTGPFEYRAGQTVDLELRDPPHSDAAGNRRTFSLAAAPGAGPLLVATRVRGSAFKRSLLEVPLGTGVACEGPFGSFTLPKRAVRVVMLAGGIGVTPFRAMVEDAQRRALEHSLLLVHANRTPGETPFLAELGEWGGRDARFTYRPVMTRAGDAREAWAGERGRVDAAFLERLVSAEPEASLFYVAGPDRFVKDVIGTLAALSVDEDRVRFEEFPGY